MTVSPRVAGILKSPVGLMVPDVVDQITAEASLLATMAFICRTSPAHAVVSDGETEIAADFAVVLNIGEPQPHIIATVKRPARERILIKQRMAGVEKRYFSSAVLESSADHQTRLVPFVLWVSDLGVARARCLPQAPFKCMWCSDLAALWKRQIEPDVQNVEVCPVNDGERLGACD